MKAVASMLAVGLIIAGAIPLADAQMSSAGIPRSAGSGDPTKQELACLLGPPAAGASAPAVVMPQPGASLSSELSAPGVTVGPTGVSETPANP